jgi:ribosome biogenesis GTPase / thiamine phosphate phosphatase
LNSTVATGDSDVFRLRLDSLGWSAWFEERFGEHRQAGHEPGRVVADYGSACVVQLEAEEVRGAIVGRLRHGASGRAVLPAVGDWVAVQRGGPGAQASIVAVLERRSALSRKEADQSTVEQVMAANVDLIFILAALSEEVNLRRLERYLTIAWNSGASPVIVLTKADLAAVPQAAADAVEPIAPGVPVILASGVTGDGLDAIRGELAAGLTGVLIGPSGVGKSTLINRLVGDSVLKTRSVRRDGKGRHTTTHRQLIALPHGGMLIDTPGLRELQLWGDETGLDQAFEDVARLAAGCRFRDCRHAGEPGCAVHGAVDRGDLPAERLASYRKLERELRALAVRASVRLQQEERRKWRLIHKAARTHARPG